MSVVVHEVSHGYAANLLGDPTAKYAGRLTLNPLKHLDPLGSVVVPIILAVFPPHMVFGWAKPVPYNPYNLKNKRWGDLIVAVAGPVSNLLLALFFGLLIRWNFSGGFLPSSFMNIAATIVFVNLILAVFNLVPIPPLDGSKVIFGVLPFRLSFKVKIILERYGLVFLIFFIFFLWQYVAPVIGFLFQLITGAGF
jgi:Zn-dependent protease